MLKEEFKGKQISVKGLSLSLQEVEKHPKKDVLIKHYKLERYFQSKSEAPKK